MSSKSKSKALQMGALDWDDTELIKAYEKSMSLKGDRRKGGSKASQMKWKVGDFCTALYQGDNAVYEAEIIALDEDNYCTIKFLGYEDEQEVDLDTLRKSKGREARKAQAVRAKEYINTFAVGNAEDASYNESEENETSDAPESSPERSHLHRKRNASSAKRSPTADMTLPTPNHYPMNNSMYPMVHPMPPVPVPDADSSLDNMCSAWYLAGYYTGLHQAEKMCKNSHKRCCCHH